MWKTKTPVPPGILFKIQANRLETRIDTRQEEIGSAWAKIHKGLEDRRLFHSTWQMKGGEYAREL